MSETAQRDGWYTCRSCGDELADIVQLLDHGCGRIPSAPDLSRRERNTLIYVETRLVDHAGKLDPEQMNTRDDRQNLKLLAAAGLLDVDEDFPGEPQVVKFTDAAWRLVSECRQYRAIEDDRFDADLGTVPGQRVIVAGKYRPTTYHRDPDCPTLQQSHRTKARPLSVLPDEAEPCAHCAEETDE